MKLDKFILGANNVSSINEIPSNSLRDCVNLDITNEGTLKQAPALSQIYSGINCHSLHDNFFVEDGNLVKLNQDNTVTPIINGQSIGKNKLSYLDLNGIIYFSSISNHGKIINSTVELFAIPNPLLPDLSIGEGNLAAGNYLVDITYEDVNTLEESGSAGTQSIKVPGNSSILLSLPDILEGLKINVYCSKQDGETLYFHSVNTDNIHSVINLSTPLETQFLSEMPLGTNITQHNARIYVANKNILYYSEASRYGLIKLSTNWIPFNSDIKLIAAVEDGLYVIADKTYFLADKTYSVAGTNLKSFKQIIVDNESSLSGNATYVQSKDIIPDAPFDLELPVWMNSNGYVVGLISGKLQQITKDRLAISDQSDFIIHKTKSNGITQLLSSVSGAQVSNYGASDRSSVTIIRNGIII